VLVKGLDGKNIVQIACGQQHTVALDSDGSVPSLFSRAAVYS
jgi:alpha-tubulin suppressor-like RCC1 family protein